MLTAASIWSVRRFGDRAGAWSPFAVLNRAASGDACVCRRFWLPAFLGKRKVRV